MMLLIEIILAVPQLARVARFTVTARPFGL
jgi:hypothetical protein